MFILRRIQRRRSKLHVRKWSMSCVIGIFYCFFGPELTRWLCRLAGEYCKDCLLIVVDTYILSSILCWYYYISRAQGIVLDPIKISIVALDHNILKRMTSHQPSNNRHPKNDSKSTPSNDSPQTPQSTKTNSKVPGFKHGTIDHQSIFDALMYEQCYYLSAFKDERDTRYQKTIFTSWINITSHSSLARNCRNRNYHTNK